MGTTKEPKVKRDMSWWPKVREGGFIFASLIVAFGVAGVTGWGSWGHIVHMGHSVGEPSADWLPVAIDGMMFNGTILVAVDRFRGRVARPWAVISLWLGAVLTLVFNLASAYERGPGAMLIAVMYPVALLCTVEAIFHPSQTTIEEAMSRRTDKRVAKALAKAARNGTPTPVVAPVAPVVVPVSAPPAPTTPETPVTPVEAPAAPTKVPPTTPRRTPAKATERPGIKNPRRSSKRGHSTGVVDEDPTPVVEATPEEEDSRVRVVTPLAIEAARTPTRPIFVGPAEN